MGMSMVLTWLSASRAASRGPSPASPSKCFHSARMSAAAFCPGKPKYF